MTDELQIHSNEFLCPVCGSVLTPEARIEGGWNCRCGEFIPEGMAVDPKEGLSNQHKQNKSWR